MQFFSSSFLKIRNVSALAMSIMLFLLLLPGVAFATYAYDYGRTSDLSYADDCVGYANSCWSTLGHNYSSYLGSNYTRSRVLTNLQYGDAFYADTHGSSSGFLDNGSGFISFSDVSTNRYGNWYKLVFVDACDTGDNNSGASSFGITDSDGQSHTYVGWSGYSYDNITYAGFTMRFFDKVKTHNSIAYSLWYAGYASGIYNYRSYGNTNWSY